MDYSLRYAELKDLKKITEIYNQGIEDRIATLETKIKTIKEMKIWFLEKKEGHKVIVAENKTGEILGWASLNTFNSRIAYDGVVDLSIYVTRNLRGQNIGKNLLIELINLAKKEGFHKIVLSTFKTNIPAQKLYKSLGFREIGTYEKQGKIDENWIDITIMEKLLI